MTVRDNETFLSWLETWFASLAPASLTRDACGDDASRTAIVVVDLLVGFCSEGALASPRVGALGPRVARFLADAWDAGVRDILLAVDSHPDDSPEFKAFPPHCITGTREADIIPELTSLPFFSKLTTITKGSLNVGLEPALGAWQAARPGVRSVVVVGDCTDFCVYQAAMHLRMQANTQRRELEIWVPADLVDTYDLSVDAAGALGALPHPGHLMHRLFLYHMALNGIRVVRGLGP